GNNGAIYIAGGYNSNTVAFGAHTVSGSNGQDMFVAKYQGYPTGVTFTTAASPYINIYPNPVGNRLTIAGAGTGTSVQLLNVLGQELYHGTISSDKETINTEAFQPGTYILRLVAPNGTTTASKVVKE